MAKFVNGKLVDEGKKVGLTINVFVAADEEIDEVTVGTHLGQGSLELDDLSDDAIYVGFSHFRPGSKVPVEFRVDELGTVEEVDVQAEGLQEIDTLKFNALAFLNTHDDEEYTTALSPEEKEELQNITYLELKKITVDSHDHNPPNTAREDAAVAIIQREGLPKTSQGPNTAKALGPLTGAVVTLEVGNDEFTEESVGFTAEIKPCEGRTLYQYNWTGVDASVLNEPK